MVAHGLVCEQTLVRFTRPARQERREGIVRARLTPLVDEQIPFAGAGALGFELEVISHPRLRLELEALCKEVASLVYETVRRSHFPISLYRGTPIRHRHFVLEGLISDDIRPHDLELPGRWFRHGRLTGYGVDRSIVVPVARVVPCAHIDLRCL